MKNSNLKIAMLFFMITMLSFSSIVYAQDKKEKFRAKDRKFMNLPNLTDEQKQKIKTLQITFQKDIKTTMNLMKEKKARLHTLQTADNADMSAINKTIDEIGTLTIEMMKKRAAHIQDIRKLLNDEQKLIFDTKKPKFNKQKRMGRDW